MTIFRHKQEIIFRSGCKPSESSTDFLLWLTSDPDDLFSFINDRMTNYAKQVKTVGKNDRRWKQDQQHFMIKKAGIKITPAHTKTQLLSRKKSLKMSDPRGKWMIHGRLRSHKHKQKSIPFLYFTRVLYNPNSCCVSKLISEQRINNTK